MVNLTVFLTIYNQLTKTIKPRIVPESELYTDAHFRSKMKQMLELSEKRFNECREDLISAYKNQCLPSIEKTEKMYEAAVYDLNHSRASNAMAHAWYVEFKTKRGSQKYFNKTFAKLQKTYRDDYIDQLKEDFNKLFPSEERQKYLSDLQFELLETY